MVLRYLLLLLMLSSTVLSTYHRHICGRELFEIMKDICEDCPTYVKNRHLTENTTYRKRRDTLVKDCCKNKCSKEYLKNFCCW